MTQQLDACPPEMRRWEWYYLHRLADGAGLTFRAHLCPVTRVAWSPDGKRVASGGDDGIVHVWDPQTGQIFSSLAGHLGGVGALAFSPDSKYLVTSNGRFGRFTAGVPGTKIDQSKVRIWEVATGKLLKTYTEHGGLVEQVAFRPDGKALIVLSWSKVGDLATLYVWEIESGKTLGKLPHSLYAGFIGLRPEGQIVLVVSGKKPEDPYRIQLLDAVTLKEAGSWPLPSGHEGFSLSPDGRRLAGIVSQGDENRLVVWDAETGKELLRADVQGTQISYSGDGKHLAVIQERGTGIYDAETAKLLTVLRESEEWPGAIAWSHDGRRLLTTPQPNYVPPYDTFLGSVKVWDLGDPAGGAPAPEFRKMAGHRGAVRAPSPSAPTAGCSLPPMRGTRFVCRTPPPGRHCTSWPRGTAKCGCCALHRRPAERRQSKGRQGLGHGHRQGGAVASGRGRRLEGDQPGLQVAGRRGGRAGMGRGSSADAGRGALQRNAGHGLQPRRQAAGGRIWRHPGDVRGRQLVDAPSRLG